MGHSFKPGLIMEHIHIIFTFRMRRQFREFIQINAKGIYCAGPEKNPYPPHGRSSEILSGKGGLKSQNFRNKCELAKLEFRRERKGAKQNTSCGGSMDIFLNCTLQTEML